ncbi:MAG: hypothetical protein VB099_21125 [Candidatus Limiplasma sp.]|nr:hypothetical protein [Candidatus Limiplasma sp.]
MADIIIPLAFTIDLDAGTRQVTIAEPLEQGDKLAHRVIMTAKRGGAAADLTGASGLCGVVLSNRQTVIFAASISGNTVTATLPYECYAVPGRIRILLRLTAGGATVTPLDVTATVLNSATDTLIDPEDIVPSLEDLLAQMDAMAAGTAAANLAAASANSAAAGAVTATANANKVANLTVSATEVHSIGQPSATLGEVDGHKHITFGLKSGKDGRDGVIADIAGGQYALYVNGDGDLILAYMTGEDPPNLSINGNGDLILTID